MGITALEQGYTGVLYWSIHSLLTNGKSAMRLRYGVRMCVQRRRSVCGGRRIAHSHLPIPGRSSGQPHCLKTDCIYTIIIFALICINFVVALYPGSFVERGMSLGTRLWLLGVACLLAWFQHYHYCTFIQELQSQLMMKPAYIDEDA